MLKLDSRCIIAEFIEYKIPNFNVSSKKFISVNIGSWGLNHSSLDSVIP